MTTIPTPPLPTDNLYKFVAISGLIALVASFYLGITETHSAGEELLKLQAIQTTAIEADATLRDIPPETYAHLLGPSLNVPKVHPDGPGYDSLIRHLTTLYTENIRMYADTIKKRGAELTEPERAKIREVIEKMKDAIIAARQAAYIVRQEEAIVKGLNLLAAIGFCAMVAGFSLWWFRLQRWQDAAVRNEVEQSKTTSIIFDMPG